MSPSRKRRKLSNEEFVAVPDRILEPGNAHNETDQNPAAEQRRSLFVRSLPASVTTERLTEYFSESFPLKHATVVLDSETKISKGFGFVTFVDAEDARKAVELFNNSTLDGRKIKVEIAESRHRDTEDGERSGPNKTAVDLKARRDKQLKDAQPPRLIVRNLPWSIKESADLAKLFQSYGKVKHAVVPKKGHKAQYGFGIVVLRGRKNAEKALAGVNGKEVDGRILAVDWAVDKQTWEQLQQSDTVSADQPQDLDSQKVEDGERDQTSSDEGSEESFHTAQGESVQSDGGIQAEIDGESESSDGDQSNGEQESSEESPEKTSQDNTTVFIRNLPFTTDDESLKEFFQSFGPVRYARVVYDHETDRSRGTGFVCFFNEDDSKACVKAAPKHEPPSISNGDKKRRGETMVHSVLQNEATDPSGRYTLEGRVLQIVRALSKTDADRRADEASAHRDKRDRGKRRLYLLAEGTISRSSPLYNQLGKAEIDIRESSARQRQKLIKSNPNLCLSLTRLSVRNIPRHLGSKELKALAREAVVGFAKDVKSGLREPLNKEEQRRDAEEMQKAETRRKEKGVGIVKQAKIVFEGKEGGKVKEGGGRSRGYGFVEYHSHRNALAGLRWLNGHMIKPSGTNQEKAKRLIVEFALENAQVVQRRTEREKQVRLNSSGLDPRKKDTKASSTNSIAKGKKRKQSSDAGENETPRSEVQVLGEEDKNRLAKRNRIIAKKRHMRKNRKG